MSLDSVIQEMLPEIEAGLKQAVMEGCNPEYPELRGMLAYHLGWEGEGAGREAQGKRIRPVLTLLSAQAADGDWRNALPAAAAVELLHNFSLIHDDIQDRSEIRRGRPTVWVKWGVAQAINAGDVMFTLAFRALYNLVQTTSPEIALEAHRILQDVCLRLTEGQYLDLAYETRNDLSLKDYWPMIAGKTSALLGGCAELGALIAGADENRRRAFSTFGVKLGLAFQVLDDWLGIWGDAALTGKSTESDLVSGKKSLPVLYTLEKDSAFARRWQQGAIQPSEVREIVAMLDSAGAQEFTLSTAEQLTLEARQALKEAVGEDQKAASLEELAERLLARRH